MTSPTAQAEQPPVFDLCDDCHQRLDPNGPGQVVMVYDHQDVVRQAQAAGESKAWREVARFIRESDGGRPYNNEKHLDREQMAIKCEQLAKAAERVEA